MPAVHPRLRARLSGPRRGSNPLSSSLTTFEPFFLRLRQQLVPLLLAQVLAPRFPPAHLFGPVVFRVPVRHSVQMTNVKNRLFAALVVLRADSLPFPIHDRVVAFHHRSQASQHLPQILPADPASRLAGASFPTSRSFQARRLVPRTTPFWPHPTWLPSLWLRAVRRTAPPGRLLPC